MKRVVTIFLLAISLSRAGDAGAAAQPDKDVRRYLPQGRELVQSAHGRFGPVADGVIMIYREEGCDDCRYEGMALVPSKGRAYRPVPLPPIRQFDNLTVQNDGIGAILFLDADGDGASEVLVLVKGLVRGPGGHPVSAAAVLDWNGGAFRALPAYENYLGDSCESAAQARAMIGLLAGVRGSYSSITEGVGANMKITLSDNGGITGAWSAVWGAAHMCDQVPFTLRQSGGTTELVSWSDEAGADVVIATLQVSGKGAMVHFIRDMSEFGCGAWHPDEVRMKRKK